MKTIADELKEMKEVPKVLALPEKTKVPQEIKDIKNKYFDKYGINNTTAQFINKKKAEIKSKNTEDQKVFVENEILKNITSSFGIYTVVTYKSMDEIAKQYNLYMSGLFRYLKPIPENNLEELDGFTEYFKTIDADVLLKLGTWLNRDFIFDPRKGNNSVDTLPFDQMFYIMAPKSHLDVSDDDLVIGREISKSEQSKPTFSYEFKVNTPEPKDPIIFFPFQILNTIYCVVITAWDEVADDLRIRKLI